MNVTFQCMFMWRLGGARYKNYGLVWFLCALRERRRREFGGNSGDGVNAGRKNAESETRKGQRVQLVKAFDTPNYDKVGPVRFEVCLGL